MNRQRLASRTLIKASVFFIAASILQSAIYLPSTINLTSPEKTLVFSLLLFNCLTPSVIIAFFSYRSSDGYSWVKFGTLYIIAYVVLFFVIGTVCNG